MGRFDFDRFRNLLELLGPLDGVAKCMPYPGMTDVPNGFDRFAHEDATQEQSEWSDVCPAYALALVSAGSYALPRDNEEMQVLWDELGGNSTKLWPDVRAAVVRSWAWLDARHPQVDQ